MNQGEHENAREKSRGLLNLMKKQYTIIITFAVCKECLSLHTLEITIVQSYID